METNIADLRASIHKLALRKYWVDIPKIVLGCWCEKTYGLQRV